MSSRLSPTLLKQTPLIPLMNDILRWQHLRGYDSQKGMNYVSSGGAKITVWRTPNKSGNYFWRYKDGKCGGTIFELMKEFYGHTPMDTIRFFTENAQICTRSTSIDDKMAEIYAKTVQYEPDILTKEQIQLIMYKNYLYPIYSGNYLTENRRISTETIRHLRLRVNAWQFCVPLMSLIDNKWTITSFHFYSINKANPTSSYKYCKGARNASVSLISNRNDLTLKTNLFIFESPIDAASYHQLFKPVGAIYMSLCGTPSGQLWSKLREYITFLKVNKIISCVDNDESGENLHKKLSDTLQGFNLERELPTIGKDYNEQLIAQVKNGQIHNEVEVYETLY